MLRKIVFYFLLLSVVAVTVFWLGSGFYSAREDVTWEKEPLPPVVLENTEEEPEAEDKEESPVVSLFDPTAEIKTVLTSNVPFASQAPYGDWSNPRYQDGCEEASITIAAYYLSGKPFSAAVMEKEILALAEYGEKEFGHFVDTSAADTAKMLEDHYDVSAEVVYDMTLADMKRALADNILVVPANGRKLQNPNFTPPGPINHMLVVTGYDMETKEFVTNDPGTRSGKNYRYAESTLYGAIRDYPTGNHLPNTAVKKAMIVIPKKK